MKTLKERIKQQKFNSVAQEAFLSIFMTSTVLRDQFLNSIKGSGITMAQYNILHILKGAYPEGYPRYAISERMIERAPDITRLIDRLIKRGLVERKQCQEDRRRSMAFITAEGLKLLEELDQRVNSFLREFEENTGAETLRQIVDMCEVILLKY